MSSLKRAFRNLTRDLTLTVSSVAAMALTFFAICVFSLVGFYLHFAIQFLEQSPQIYVYFTDDAEEEYILQIKEELESVSEISSVEHTSKEAALETYIAQYKDQPMLLESISANIFPASLDIKVSDIQHFERVADKLAELQYVESIDFHQEVVTRLREISSTTRLVGGALILLLVFISMLNILLTIGMTIRSQKTEIEIMRLVGATGWYIVKPYLLQGILYAFFSSLVVGILLFMTLPYILPEIYGFFSGVPIPAIDTLVMLGILVGSVFAIGLVIGMFGSIFASFKYLRK